MSYEVAVCPRCGRERSLEALSRRDNKTMICSPCGRAERFIDIGISVSEEDKLNEKEFVRRLRGCKANE